MTRAARLRAPVQQRFPESLLKPDEAEAALALLPLSLRVWLSAEQERVTREVDPRRVERGDVGCVPGPFLPESGRVFRLATRWAPAAAVRVTDSGVGEDAVRRFFFRRRSVLFLAHPLASARLPEWLAGAPPGHELYAAATSSTRTVLAWGLAGGCPPFFAKLSVPGELSGASRVVGETEAVASVGLTRLLVALGCLRALLEAQCIEAAA